MFIGFDYGTANCSVAIMQNGQPQLLKMENGSTLLPSMLCAPTREAVSEWLFRHHQVPATAAETQAVIGRPINFQGLGGDEANQQAQGILERAAHRAGFRDVVFQYEPVAAGLDFEATLTEEKRVLVVDIGGGTTDCSQSINVYRH